MFPALVQGQQNNSQMLDQMIGSEYGGEIACIATWNNGGNYYTYNPRIGWYGNMFDTTMPQIYRIFPDRGFIGRKRFGVSMGTNITCCRFGKNQ